MVMSGESTRQEANTIILEMSGDKDDYKDLIRSKGKSFKKIAKIVEQLKEEGEVAEDAQPVIVIVKKKKDWWIVG